MKKSMNKINDNLRFELVDGTDADFIKLCHELDAFLNDLVGGEENRAEYIPYNQLNDIHDAIIAYISERPVGCASYKRMTRTTAEVKRVFIQKEYRGKKISKKLMSRLEQLARDRGYHELVLESGEALVAAMKLYRGIGYQVIPNYEPYRDMPDSVCMCKQLQD